MSKLPTTSRLPVTPSKIATTVPKSGLRPPQTAAAALSSSSSSNVTPSQQTSPSATVETFSIGDRVTNNGKIGTVAFIGSTKFAEGEWIGVILDDTQGKNDGSYEGTRYFETEPNRGLFCRPAKLQRLPQSAQTTTNDAPKLTTETDKPVVSDDLRVGDRVVVSGSKFGTLRYIGKIHVAEGVWCGIQLDEAQGKNDGSVSGKRYFTCQQRYGLFSPVARVEKVNSDAQTVQATARKESVSSSTANSRPLHRSNSQESLHSNISELSTSSNSMSRIPMRTPGKLPTHPYTTPNTKTLLTQAAATLAATQPSNTQVANLIQALKDKDVFIEKLQQQREQDRLEFSRAAQQVDEMESRMLAFKQQFDTKEAENEQLKKEQYETKQRLEDLEFQLEEYKLNETNREQITSPIIPEGHRLLTPKDLEIYEEIKGKVLNLESMNQKLVLEKQTIQDEHRQEINTMKTQLTQLQNDTEVQHTKLTDELRAKLQATETHVNERMSQLKNYEETVVPQLKAQLADLLSSGDSQTTAIETLRVQLQAAETLANQQMVQLKNYEETVVPQLKTQVTELLSSGENQTTVLAQQLKQSNKDLEQLRAQLQLIQSEKQSIEKTAEERILQLKTYEETVVPQLKNQLADLLSSGDSQTTTLETLRAQVQAAETLANERMAQLKNYEETVVPQLNAQLSDLISSGDSQTTSLETLRTQLQASEAQANERMVQLKNYEETVVPQLKEQLNELMNNSENQTTTLDTLRAQLQEAEAQASERMVQLKNYEETVVPQLKAQLTELMNNSENQTITLETLRAQLQATDTLANERIIQLKNYEEIVIPQLKSQLTDAVTNLENHTNLFGQQSVESKKSLDEIHQRLTVVQEEKAIIVQKYETLKAETEMRDKQLVEISNDCRIEFELKIKELADEKSKLEIEIESLRNELQSVQLKYQQHSTSNDNELNEKQAHIDRLNKEIQVIREETHEKQSQLRQTIEQYETKLQALNNEKEKHITVDSNNEKQPIEELQGQIQFLNDVIVDLQNTNDSLKKEIEFLKNPYLHDEELTENAEVVMRTKTGAAPRLYCDMCEVFDQHDTDDCPKQSSMVDDQTSSMTGQNRERVIPPARAYCDKCEEFGHDCNEIDETY